MKKIKLIAAVSIDGAIGNDEKMLWKIPEDLQRYKKLTTGNILIVGRKTYEGLPKVALKGRTHIVVSKTGIVNAPADCEVYVSKSIEEAFKKAQELEGSERDIYVIGGSNIYEQTIQRCSSVEITWINNIYTEANKRFPITSLFENFSIENDSGWNKNKESNLSYKFTTYKKD